jgi:hypothetical protein
VSHQGSNNVPKLNLFIGSYFLVLVKKKTKKQKKNKKKKKQKKRTEKREKLRILFISLRAISFYGLVRVLRETSTRECEFPSGVFELNNSKEQSELKKNIIIKVKMHENLLQ